MSAKKRGRPRGPGSARDREHKPDKSTRMTLGAQTAIDACARKRGLVCSTGHHFRHSPEDARLMRHLQVLETESELCGEDKW